MERGYVKVWRKFFDSFLYKDSQAVHLWLHLLLKATHKEVKVLWGGKTITLKPGELITGRKALSKEIGVNEYKIFRLLKLLKSEQLIAQRTNKQSSIISITNWDEHQSDAQQFAQRMHNECTTDAQRMHTNKNVKNVKNKNKYTEEFEAFWKAYPTHKNSSKPNSLALWNKLSAEEKADAMKHLPQFIKDAGKYFNKCDNYLKGKLWEGKVAKEEDRLAQTMKFF